jgi:cytochrome c2
VRLAASLGLLAAAACATAAPADDSATLEAGERAFQKCYACHSLEGPDPNTEGPSLNGVVGRDIASQAGFAYSPAMRAYAVSQGRWSREALDAFIADPQGMVPDNAMGFFGIANAEERRALIEYLANS